MLQFWTMLPKEVIFIPVPTTMEQVDSAPLYGRTG